MKLKNKANFHMTSYDIEKERVQQMALLHTLIFQIRMAQASYHCILLSTLND